MKCWIWCAMKLFHFSINAGNIVAPQQQQMMHQANQAMVDQNVPQQRAEPPSLISFD